MRDALAELLREVPLVLALAVAFLIVTVAGAVAMLLRAVSTCCC